VSDLLHGKKAVTSQMATLIARGVCGTLENWLRMQEALNFWSDEIKFNINFKAV
jgi:plasmid maintenance system antidote protein VapI